MCGLAGIVVRRGAARPELDGVRRAAAALTHRGPDGTNFYSDAAAAFGHTRLSIIDLVHGDQPMKNEDGSVVTVYNGEIWNYKELRRDLEGAGHRFSTNSDTEVLVHGYEEWREGLPARLNGMFAFAIWDERRELLLLARDRLGKKPMFIAETPNGLAFGSDIRSVLLSGDLRPEVDGDRVAEYLFQRYVTAPHTLVRGVTKLQPGHLLTYDRSIIHRSSYWRITPTDSKPISPGELRDLLIDATRRRLMSDVPLGVLLSGGVDSNAVLALMREAGASTVASFTIGFTDSVYDERRWARIAADRFGTEHFEVVVGPDDFIKSLPRLAWYRDEPIAEPSEIPLLLLAEFAGQHVKVVLTGDGGDEVFGGYPKYRAERLLNIGGPAAAVALRAAGRIARSRPTHRRLGRAIETLAVRNPLLRWASWFRTFAPAELERILVPELHESASPERLTTPLRDHLQPYAESRAGDRLLLGDLLTYLPDNMLARGDKVLMAASVEGRMPLLDYRIVERAVALPISARAGLLSAKAVLRKAIAGLVPSEILRQPKRGFPVPVARFLLEDPTRSLQNLLLSERTLSRGLYQPNGLQRLVQADGSAGTDFELKLFTLGMLELWLRTNVDEVSLEPPTYVTGFDTSSIAAHAQTAAGGRTGG
jgi:asparagine synthase (glutamine-hydrolysing)